MSDVSTNLSKKRNKLSCDVKSVLVKLTETQKQQAKQLIKMRKAESYVEYLKYVNPSYVWTKFHMFLAMVCDSVVKS